MHSHSLLNSIFLHGFGSQLQLHRHSPQDLAVFSPRQYMQKRTKRELWAIAGNTCTHLCCCSRQSGGGEQKGYLCLVFTLSPGAEYLQFSLMSVWVEQTGPSCLN